MRNSRHFATSPLVSREMTYDERAQKFHTKDVTTWIWVVLLID